MVPDWKNPILEQGIVPLMSSTRCAVRAPKPAESETRSAWNPSRMNCVQNGTLALYFPLSALVKAAALRAAWAAARGPAPPAAPRQRVRHALRGRRELNTRPEEHLAWASAPEAALAGPPEGHAGPPEGHTPALLRAHAGPQGAGECLRGPASPSGHTPALLRPRRPPENPEYSAENAGKSRKMPFVHSINRFHPAGPFSL